MLPGFLRYECQQPYWETQAPLPNLTLTLHRFSRLITLLSNLKIFVVCLFCLISSLWWTHILQHRRKKKWKCADKGGDGRKQSYSERSFKGHHGIAWITKLPLAHIYNMSNSSGLVSVYNPSPRWVCPACDIAFCLPLPGTSALNPSSTWHFLLFLSPLTS